MNTAWNFALDRNEAGKVSFVTVAVHELAHVLGVGSAPSWSALQEVERFLSIGLALDDAAAAVQVYARVATALQERHPDIYPGMGQNDLWIAAVAMQAELPLLTRPTSLRPD